MSCNASKGAKELRTWLESNYCKCKDITVSSVAEVVKNAFVGEAPNPLLQRTAFGGR
jgi:hypothetical protein